MDKELKEEIKRQIAEALTANMSAPNLEDVGT